MLILAVDVETQSLNRETTRLTEVAGILYDVSLETNVWVEVNRVSSLCYELDYPPQPELIVRLTRITDDMLKEQGRPRKDVLEDLAKLMEQADLCMAHRASFDKTVLEFNAKLVGVSLPVKKWFCTMTDIRWGVKYRCMILAHLSYDHSILVDPITLHRATDDINLMVSLVQKYQIKDLMDFFEKPWAYLTAECQKPWLDDYLQVNIAKDLGFQWEQLKYVDDFKVPKAWVNRVKEDEVDEILEAVKNSASPFKISLRR